MATASLSGLVSVWSGRRRLRGCQLWPGSQACSASRFVFELWWFLEAQPFALVQNLQTGCNLAFFPLWGRNAAGSHRRVSDFSMKTFAGNLLCAGHRVHISVVGHTITLEVRNNISSIFQMRLGKQVNCPCSLDSHVGAPLATR